MKEELFIITASKLDLSENDISLLQQLSKDISDWQLLLEHSGTHAVAPLMYQTLKKYSLTDLVPSDVLDRLKATFYATVSSNLKYLQLIEKIAALTDEKIVLLKGIDLVESLYKNLGARSMFDIDVLVEKKSLNAIASKLLSGKEMGNVFEHSFSNKSAVHEQVKLQKTKHIPPIFFPHGRVELHWNLFEGEDYYDITEKAWTSMVPYKQSRNLCRLSNEVMLLHLCTHFYDHAHDCLLLRMLCDINELITQYRECLKWDEIRSLCNCIALRNEVNTALTYSMIFFATHIPEDFIVHDMLRNTPKSLTQLLSGIPDLQLSKRQKIISDLRMLPRLKDKITYTYRIFVPEKEWISQYYHHSSRTNLFQPYFNYWKKRVMGLITKG
jgi:hypothetical protein